MSLASHTKLETLRQEAARGDWVSAVRTCSSLQFKDETNPEGMELVLAVWRKDPTRVASAIAKLEAANYCLFD